MLQIVPAGFISFKQHWFYWVSLFFLLVWRPLAVVAMTGEVLWYPYSIPNHRLQLPRRHCRRNAMNLCYCFSGQPNMLWIFKLTTRSFSQSRVLKRGRRFFTISSKCSHILYFQLRIHLSFSLFLWSAAFPLILEFVSKFEPDRMVSVDIVDTFADRCATAARAGIAILRCCDR